MGKSGNDRFTDLAAYSSDRRTALVPSNCDRRERHVPPPGNSQPATGRIGTCSQEKLWDVATTTGRQRPNRSASHPGFYGRTSQGVSTEPNATANYAQSVDWFDRCDSAR